MDKDVHIGGHIYELYHVLVIFLFDSDMIYISHIPVFGEVEPMEGGTEITATLIPVGGEPVSEIFAEIRYRYNNSSFQSTALNWDSDNENQQVIIIL